MKAKILNFLIFSITLYGCCMGHYDCSDEPYTALHTSFASDSQTGGFTQSEIDSFIVIRLNAQYPDTKYFKDMYKNTLNINPLYNEENLVNKYHYQISNLNGTVNYDIRIESIETEIDKGRCIDCYYLKTWEYSVNGTKYIEYSSNAYFSLTKQHL